MKIGEFAKMGDVSIKTLHLYHEMELLIPKEVNESGHRIYSESSFKKLKKIKALKKLNFSLIEIQGLLSDEIPSLTKSLKLQKNRVAHEISQKKHEMYRIKVAQKIIQETGDCDKMMETINKLSRGEKYFSLQEIKRIESINENNQQINTLNKEKESWYDGLLDAFKEGLSVSDPRVKVMAKKWDQYAQYWKKNHPSLTKKIIKMDKETPKKELGLVATAEFQSYVKKAIEELNL